MCICMHWSRCYIVCIWVVNFTDVCTQTVTFIMVTLFDSHYLCEDRVQFVSTCFIWCFSVECLIQLKRNVGFPSESKRPKVQTCFSPHVVAKKFYVWHSTCTVATWNSNGHYVWSSVFSIVISVMALHRLSLPLWYDAPVLNGASTNILGAIAHAIVLLLGVWITIV
jgi:hypothetical protein